MKLSDDVVIDRIREALASWADEEPVSEPALSNLIESSSNTLVELAAEAPAHRRRSMWLVAAAAAVVVVGVVAILVVRSNTPARVVDVSPSPSTITEIPIGNSFGVRGLDVTSDAVWVTSQFDEELYRVDPATNRVVATLPIPDHVEGVRAVDGSLWLSRYDPNEVVQLDPSTGALVNRITFDSQPNLATDGRRLWVIAERDGQSQIVEIDPDTAAELARFHIDAPPGFTTFDAGSLWVSSFGTTSVSRFDLAAGRVTAVVDVGGEPRSVVAAGGSIWVAVNTAAPTQTGAVVRIDPATNAKSATVVTGRWVHSLAAGDNAVWATNFRDGTLSVIDARSAHLVATTPIGNRPGGVAVGHGAVWLTPHRRNALLRIDPTSPLETAAVPDVARTIEVATGTTYIRCSGHGTPTVVLPGNKSEGAPWAVVEARLSRLTRVCAYEPVGVADPGQADLAGPAAIAADDLAATLDAVDERGPFVVVGEWIDGLAAQMFAATHRDDVVGLVLVNGMSSDYLERVRSLLPADALERMNQAMVEHPVELQRLAESSAQVAAIGGFGDLPLVALSDAAPNPLVTALNSDPILTVVEADAISQLLATTRQEQAALSTSGRLVVAAGQVTPADIVEATMSVVGAG
jgi:DNA-binding beta-propeller fold protein YncE/pimeloyl-ACP methyl ester carboxylesterase